MVTKREKKWLDHLLTELTIFSLQTSYIPYETLKDMFYNLIEKVKHPTIRTWLVQAQLCGYAIHHFYNLEKIKESWKPK